MHTTFLQTIGDETLRIELGAAVLADLAVENLELSTSSRSQAVRRSVLGRRAHEPAGVVVLLPIVEKSVGGEAFSRSGPRAA